MNMQTVQQFLRARWQTLALVGGLFAALGVLQFVVLGSLLSGFSLHEVEAYRAGLSLHDIWREPLNAPFSLLAYVFVRLLPSGSLFATRLAAACIGTVIVVIFFALTRAWYGQRTALLATALFGSSSWFLHTSRLGTAGVLTFGLFAMVAAVAWARRTMRPLAWFTCLVLAAGLLYVPGMIWLLAAGVLWQIRTFGGLAWQRRWVTFGGGAAAIALVAPLAWALYRSPHLIRVWLGVPTPLSGVGSIVHAIIVVPVHVLAWGPGRPEHWLGHVPMLDIFSIVMVVFGVAALLQRSRRLAIGFGLLFALSCVVVGLGVIKLSVLAPFAYLLVAGGVQDLLGRWLYVFPRNPIARQLGVGLMTLVVVAACTYNIRAYFIAWPQSKVTESAFTYRHP